MKKLLAIVLALIMTVGACAILASCQGNGGEESDTSGTQSSESQAESQSESKSETTKETESGSSATSSTESSDTSSTESSDTTESSETTEAPIVDVTEIYGNADALDMAGVDWDKSFFANIKHTVNEDAAIEIGADELVARMKDRDGDVALRDGEVYLVKEKIVFASGEKYYGNGAAIIAEGGVEIKDAVDVVVKDVIVKGELSIINSHEIIFFKLDLQSDAVAVTVDADSSDISFNTCRLYGNELSVDSKADYLTVYCSYVRAIGGMTLEGDDNIVQNCKIYAILNGVSAKGDNNVIRENTVRAEVSGQGIVILEGSQNALVALNDIEGIQKSIVVDGGFNCSVILNRAVSMRANDTTNLYIVDNKFGGYIRLENNNYVISDGNTYPSDTLDHTTLKYNNQNVNGNGLTDVDARVEVGANEEILPHTNKDLFVGMPRKTSVNDASFMSAKGLNAFIRDSALQDDVVIVPPGAYSVPGRVSITADHSNTTIYAYGVYEEYSELDYSRYIGKQLEIANAQNVNIYGLTVGYALPSSGQVRVVDKYQEGNSYKLTVIADAGFWDGLTKTDTNLFHDWWPEMFLVDESTGEYLYRCDENPKTGHSIVKNYDEDGNYDGTMTFTLHDRGTNPYMEGKPAKSIWERVALGTVITCRLANGNRYSIHISGSTNVTLRDCTLYGYAAALANYSTGSANITYERFHNTTHSESLIDKETYDKYVALEEKWGVDFEVREETLADGTVRYRGAPSRSGSVDAFHITHNKTGVNVISSLLEGMVDDGSNQHASSSRMHGYQINDDGTTTIYIKATATSVNWSNAVGLATDVLGLSSCPWFNAGDIAYIYAPSGATFCETEVITGQVKTGTVTLNITEGGVTKIKPVDVHAITVKTEECNFDALKDPVTGEEYDLTDNHFRDTLRVTVDNLSKNSSNYVMDNVMVYNGHSRGFLIKSTDVTIKHCTFRNVSYSALLLRPETEWAESSVARRILIQQCLFDHTGYIFNGILDKGQACIRIQSTSTVVSENTLPIDDITITGCKFTNNEQRVAIWVNSAKNVKITNNIFDDNVYTDLPNILGTAVLLDTCMGVELSGNTYNYEHYKGDVKNVVKGSNYANIFGTDVTDENGDPILPDNIVTPE